MIELKFLFLQQEALLILGMDLNWGRSRYVQIYSTIEQCRRMTLILGDVFGDSNEFGLFGEN
jgi:hypothetical protein